MIIKRILSNFKAISFSILFCISFFSRAQDFSEVDKILESKKDDFKGHVIFVVKKGDSTLHQFQTGLAKLDTKIPIASASKWLTSAVVLSLVDQGYFSLDDSIGKYLPQFSKYDKGKPTIRQCLAHTSGFPAYANLDYKDLSLSQLVDSMAKYTPMKNKPGEVFNYGGMSYRVVGSLAEAVTGKSWNTLFQETVAAKCDMLNTTYCHEKIIPDLAGGVCSTPTDYLHFLNMVSNKGKYKGFQVLSEASVKEFFTSQLSSGVREGMVKSNQEMKIMAEGKEISYGLGTWIYNYQSDKTLQSELFCPGALGTFPFVDSCRNIYGIILTHSQIGKVVNTELKVISSIKEKYPSTCK